MKNKTEVSRTDVCVSRRVAKGAMEGGGGVMAEKMDKRDKVPPPATTTTNHHNHHPSSPPLSPPTQTKIKCESPTVFLASHTPPPSGPGAEVKGKPGNPIPSGSAKPPTPNSAGGEDVKPGGGGGAVAPSSGGGGRLTFFNEGKFVLELSHRTEMGAPAGWVPVKSKTYWPPPSSTTTTTTQHPLRHDTPTSQSVSDDCSSLNSSPWTSDHIRKQPMPRPARSPSSPPMGALFWFCCPPKARTLKRQVTGGWRRRRRNPLFQPSAKQLSRCKVEKEAEERKIVKKEKVEGEGGRGARVEKWVRMLWVRARIEADGTLQNLLDQRSSSGTGVGAGGGSAGAGEAVDPTFVSPRKRYLRQMETEQDTPAGLLHRKKMHATGLPQSHSPLPQVSSAAASSASLSSSSSALPLSVSAPHRSSMSGLAPSVYSIDSILNHSEGASAGAGTGTGKGASRRGDSFLRTLLKPEVKASLGRPRERPPDPAPPAPVKPEHEQAGQERGDPLLDLNRPSPDLSRYGPMASLYHLAPYMDPRYMMLHSLAPGLVASTTPQPTEVAQALAAAAAAAGLGTYPLAPLPPPLPGATPYYYPTTSATVASQLLRPPPSISSRSSPLPPASPSPSPKTHYPTPTPASPHHLSRGASPRGRASPWHPPPPPAHCLSPHTSLPSPPPQDAPLNLSKPRTHLGK